MGWMAGVKFLEELIMGIFSLRHPVQTGSGTHRASYQMDTRGEADEAWNWHSPPFSAEFKNAWIYTCTPKICLHGVVIS